MSSDFDVAIARPVPLINDFDDVDPTIATINSSGRRSEIRMRLDLNTHPKAVALAGLTSRITS
jgi:hypothetical protein